MDRRGFLHSAAASVALAQDASTIRVALIIEPTGDHLAQHLRTGLCAGIDEFAIADETGQTFELARKTLGRRTFRPYRDPARMMSEFSPQLVVVSMEPRRMPAAIEVALGRGAHVVAEKPGCATLAQFEKLAQLASAGNRQLMLGMASRLYPGAVRARELIQAGWIGRGYGVDMHWIADQTRLKDPAYHKSWKSSRTKGGGGKLIFHGIHYIDLIRFLTGDIIAQVCGFCRNVGGQPIEVEDAAVVSMVFASGMVGTLNTGYYLDRGYANLVALWGAEGWLRFEPRRPASLSWYSTAQAAPRGVQQLVEAASAPVYDLMLQAAIDFSRGLRAPFMTTAESLGALRAVFAAYRAAETGATQKVERG
jgi:UDP-N-acetylglucosamine 3-dehydrogenase